MSRTTPSLCATLGVVVLLLLAAGCGVDSGDSSTKRQSVSQKILKHPRISLANFHVSGRRDSATALGNLRQAASGEASRRSYYGRAPGGSVRLNVRMLSALNRLADEGYRMRLTEVAGGSHSSNSRHYAGVAFDLDFINGTKVGYGNPHYRRFMKRCRQLGATEVLGPGDRGHNTHVHVAWPRP